MPLTQDQIQTVLQLLCINKRGFIFHCGTVHLENSIWPEGFKFASTDSFTRGKQDWDQPTLVLAMSVVASRPLCCLWPATSAPGLLQINTHSPWKESHFHLLILQRKTSFSKSNDSAALHLTCTSYSCFVSF